jgi:RNA polymerase sigma factor (TIGR02999 family)
VNEVTAIVNALAGGDASAAGQLLPLVYDELRRLAAQKLAHEKPGQTLEPTALVHEAYLRLVEVEPTRPWNGRGHFFAAAAEAMRRILVEQARRKKRLRHGGEWHRVELSEPAARGGTSPDDLLALDDALARLAQDDGPAAEVAKLRLFAGLSVEEAAEALGLSRAAAYRHWTYARAWLRCALGDGDAPTP